MSARVTDWFAMQFFCSVCGKHKHTPPFGSDDPFWDYTEGPCPHCGTRDRGVAVIARRERIGSWWRRRWGRWLDTAGREVDVLAPVSGRREPAQAAAHPALRPSDFNRQEPLDGSPSTRLETDDRAQ